MYKSWQEITGCYLKYNWLTSFSWSKLWTACHDSLCWFNKWLWSYLASVRNFTHTSVLHHVDNEVSLFLKSTSTVLIVYIWIFALTLVAYRWAEISTMGDFPYLEWLARDYKQRGEKSGLWTDYLKVFCLESFDSSI